jgi:hypothetical protein
MEGGRNHRVPVAILAIAFLIPALPVLADEENNKPPPYRHTPTVVVYTNPSAAVVEADASSGVPGAIPIKVTGRRKCHLEPDTAPVTNNNLDIYAAARDRGEESFNLICDGQWIALVWRKIEVSPRTPVPSQEVAMHIREEVPMPQVFIRANPDLGLVGSESWFWVEGYSGMPINESTDAFGRLVEVEAKVDRYEWSFGDGSLLTSSSLGRAYPQRSDVRHTYQRSSAGLGIGYPVEVRFIFSVRYRVEAGEWTSLPGISRTASFRYSVQESQAVISR